ncbi:UPF0158 family protein [Alteromonas hispanica]|uniref:Uncharacterized protein n=1 Tax=Alteromonas hispanica TaxID=315421 RepID=A0A6L9MYI8_9ALTE|nr:UPF0158 family protein [Alteromonas hispanica]NDW22901.1 hypothetical protein [Alteromonas hispanica]
MQVKIDDIEMAIEFASSSMFDSEAYINVDTGEIHYVGDLVDEHAPIDIFEDKKYICFPRKVDLDLGKSVALDFVTNNIPEKIDVTYDIFSRKGAFSKFKNLLASLDQLDNWYEYEQAALRSAALEWCRENGIDVSIGT